MPQRALHRPAFETSSSSSQRSVDRVRRLAVVLAEQVRVGRERDRWVGVPEPLRDPHHINASVNQLRSVSVTQLMERDAEAEFVRKLAPARAERVRPLWGALPIREHEVVLAEL